jgi:putative Mn2+ efflux pump MntP
VFAPDYLSIILIAFGLSADCFAVSVSSGTSSTRLSWPTVLRVSIAFGFFQALMPAIGWLLGLTVVGLIADIDHWVAFALLDFVGGKMIWESFHGKENENQKKDFTKGLFLLTLAVATSIDALAVGLSLALARIDILVACITIGTITLLVTAIGFVIGRKAGQLFGRYAEIAGGIILIGIGLRIVLNHII